MLLFIKAKYITSIRSLEKKKQLGSVLESFRDGYFSSRNVFPLKSKVSSVCVWRFTSDINRKKIAFNALLC